MAEVRVARVEEREALRELFARAGEGAPSESLWGHSPSEAAIYLDPYLDQGVLLVAFQDGTPAGYLAGCLDETEFPGTDELISRTIREHRLLLRPGPLAFFARSTLDVVGARIRRVPTSKPFVDPRWPAHLHINVEPRARGTGAAQELMRQWQAKVTEAGKPGCYLGTQAENARAIRFFEKSGFTKHGPTPLIPGSRFRGARVHQQVMVWDAPR
ncbi:GNAT family N-acetyltransferase [Saccharopolyspora dendranthemae]|uniref:Acetyltransferase (GNAT) family protein n=1 Tax=Saccharopolyspora dendranthemae TaxID=1181886 RepID=A0A561V9Q1_9PSEU|nr:GNAT family N-acetyltransferase [Saccharopolyspora dendranthemae]TWG08349.1 acetyltransferase (GNAT) family protein [Saccharopolyspora dendranthemae]